MKKIIIFTMLLLVSFTMASTSETFAFEIFNPEDEDDPYTTQSDDIVFEGGGGGTIDRSLTQPGEISDINWTDSDVVDATDFDYTNPNYDMDNSTVYNNKLFVPILNSETEVDQCSDLSGTWLRTGETYRVSSRFLGTTTYYHSIGETGDFSVGDNYYYDLDNGIHEVYKKYDICQEYAVVELSTSLSREDHHLHWSYSNETANRIENYQIYLFNAVYFLNQLGYTISEEELVNNTNFLNHLNDTLSIYGGGAVFLGGMLMSGPLASTFTAGGAVLYAIGLTAYLNNWYNTMIQEDLVSYNDMVTHNLAYLDLSEFYISIKIGVVKTWQGQWTTQASCEIMMTNSNELPLENGFGEPFMGFGNFELKSNNDINIDSALDNYMGYYSLSYFNPDIE